MQHKAHAAVLYGQGFYDFGSLWDVRSVSQEVLGLGMERIGWKGEGGGIPNDTRSPHP